MKYFITIVLFCLYLSKSFSQTYKWDFNPVADSFSSSSFLDLRSMNEAYAGENGFIELSPDSSSFVTGDNRNEIRFWAVNGATEANGMTDEELAYYARFLAKTGVNMIRYHGSLHPRSSYSPLNQADQNEINNIQRVVAAMKKEGIYTTVSVYYTHMVDDIFNSWNIPGYPNGDKKLSGVVFFHDELKNAIKNWISQLLNAPNPFTGVALINEPALALIQIHNEDGVFFYTISNVSPEFYEVIKQKFYNWLVEKYGSAESAISSWNNLTIEGDSPLSGKMALYNIYDATLELIGNKALRMNDQINFLYDAQDSFYNDIYSYLRSIGCRQLINGSNWKTASAARLLDAERAAVSITDVMAVNRYYSPDHVGTNSSWRIDPGHYYAGKSVLYQPEKMPVNIKQPVKRPFVITESGWNLPHKYQAEGPFLVSAYMSLSGVDAFYWFNASSYTYDPNPYYYWTTLPGGQHPLSRWTISIPGQMAMFPANAIAFRKGYIQEGDTALLESRTKGSILARNIPEISEDLSFDPNRDDYLPAPGQTPSSPLTYLTGKVMVRYDSERDTSEISHALTWAIDYSAKKVTSLTGEITWDYNKGLCTVNTPRFQGLCGFPEPGREYVFSDAVIRSGNKYLAANIVSMDGESLNESNQILVQIGTIYQPTGWTEIPATFDNRGTQTEGFLIQNTGSMPWQADNTDVYITLKNKNILQIKKLDANGYFKKQVIFYREGENVRFKLPDDAMYLILDSNPVGVKENPEGNHRIRIFPNPSFGKIEIELPEPSYEENSLDIINITGTKLVNLKNITGGTYDLTASLNTPGIYFAVLKVNDKTIDFQKIIIY